MKEKSEQIILDIPVREFNVFEEKDEIMDTIKMMIDKSYLLDGGSGVGKSYYCVKLTEFLGEGKYLALCFTNVACDNLRK